MRPKKENQYNYRNTKTKMENKKNLRGDRTPNWSTSDDHEE